MSRWVRVQDDVFENPIFRREPYGKMAAFIWLSQVWDGADVRLIANTLGWPENRVWKFLRDLIAHGLIEAEKLREAEIFYRKKARRSPIPEKVKFAVSKRDGSVCRYCGCAEGPFHFDHIFPWSKGGEHNASNLVIACQTCNLKKKDRTLKEMGWSL